MLDRNLEIFIRAAENLSLTKAAKELFVTQPAVSNAIRKLETDLNIKLFLRNKRSGIRLTSAGEKILTLAKQMENLDNLIYQAAFEENNLVGGRLRIGTLPTLTSAIVSKTLRAFLSDHPDVTVEIKEGSPNDVLKIVESHSVDFALSCEPYRQFENRPLIQDHLVAMLPDDYPEVDNVDIRQPQDRLIVNRHAYDTILDFLPEGDFLDTEQIFLVDHPETAIHMASDGVGLAIVSAFTLDSLAPGSRYRPIAPYTGFEIGVFAHRLKDMTPVSTAFIAAIEKTITENYPVFQVEPS